MKNMIFEYPIKETLGNVFRIIQGHQITDEEIYKSYGSIPVYTGAGELKGFWDKALVEKDDLPCLTYATKAFDGTIVIRNEIFDANNTAVLILKDKYKGENMKKTKIFFIWLPELQAFWAALYAVSWLSRETK